MTVRPISTIVSYSFVGGIIISFQGFDQTAC